MNKENWHEYRDLQNAGWDVQKQNQIRLNSGSESVKHAVAKILVALVGHNDGYRISSEVEHKDRGEIDMLLYGVPDRLTLAVECETSPTMEVVEDKVSRYVDGTPVDDMALVNLSEMPLNMLDAFAYVQAELGL